MAEYAHAPSPIKNKIHGSALSSLEHLAHYRGKKKSVSWHFTLEQLVFRASQRKQKIIQRFSLSKETKIKEKKNRRKKILLLVPVLQLLLIIFCYQFFYMCQFVV